MTEPAPTESWWRPDQVELVTDTSRTWRRARFAPRDAISHRYPGKSNAFRKRIGKERPARSETVIPDGWDHEHCYLCFETISAQPDEVNEGWTDSKAWLCSDCYHKYIESKNNSQPER